MMMGCSDRDYQPPIYNHTSSPGKVPCLGYMMTSEQTSSTDGDCEMLLNSAGKLRHGSRRAAAVIHNNCTGMLDKFQTGVDQELILGEHQISF